MSDRPEIPADLRRKILVEAEHRCAICKQIPVDIHHIVPWEKVKEHSFDNLIALCCLCHARHHRYKDIDQKSLQIYKANLGLLKNRYGEFERRLLQVFCENPQSNIPLPGLSEIQVFYLLKDGLLIKNGKDSGISSNGIPTWEEYQLTARGKAFIDDWKQARPLE